ncbi:PP2C family protein-serine/threonine phosphatase [Streptomyces sp. MS19]|uniref:PP2C family protein-serine/threonine phosphatase n=1 Tax=Streptomyces sp. MS19 TaxID=3385972 RepID=UPI0039A07E70
MGAVEEEPQPPDGHAGPELTLTAEHVSRLAQANERMRALLGAMTGISGELDLPAVLRRIVATAMELVGARYGALGVLDESGEGLAEFIPVGLSAAESQRLAGVPFPRGRGLLGLLIERPEPVRVRCIQDHPGSVGFPPGHPPMRTMLGVAIGVRGRVYGNLYLSERHDGRPFDKGDEAVVVALASAAGVAVENARLFAQVRDSAENFQRMLLPRIPDLAPFEAAAVYRTSTERGLRAGQVGGDWYDALRLPDGSLGVVIGDVVGHDLAAAAAMAQIRHMLRALLYVRHGSPAAVLAELDRTLGAITDQPITTACLARVAPADGGHWRLTWTSAGHTPPLLVAADGTHTYLDGEPGLPLGVDPDVPRPEHTVDLPPGATLLLFTDGLVEDRTRSIDSGLAELAGHATEHIGRPLDVLCRTLADLRPSDGHDDLALLALRTPADSAHHIGT